MRCICPMLWNKHDPKVQSLWHPFVEECGGIFIPAPWTVASDGMPEY